MAIAARSGPSALVLIVAGTVPATAQVHIGHNLDGGIYWHVAAPEGARWRLECRFPAVTYERNTYQRRVWTNKITVRGGGPQDGRLPLYVGHCHLWKTGGQGAVGLGLFRPDETAAGATRDPGRPAAAGFL